MRRQVRDFNKFVPNRARTHEAAHRTRSSRHQTRSSAQLFAFCRHVVNGKSTPLSLFDLSGARILWQQKEPFTEFSQAYARFSPDGQQIGVTLPVDEDNSEMRVLRVADGSVLSRWNLKRDGSAKPFFVWTPDGKTLVVSGMKPLHPDEKDAEKVCYPLETRRASDGKLLRSFATRFVGALDCSSDGRALVLVTSTQILPGDYTNFGVSAIDAQTGRELWKSDDPAQTYTDAKFSSDGNTVTVFNLHRDKIELRDAQSGKIRRTLLFPPSSDHISFFRCPRVVAQRQTSVRARRRLCSGVGLGLTPITASAIRRPLPERRALRRRRAIQKECEHQRRAR